MSKKNWNELPFKLGATSYSIIAGLEDNFRWLAERFDSVQMIVFDTPALSNFPPPALVSVLRRIAEDGELSVTVHLPDLPLGSFDEALRRRAVEETLRYVERLSPICPFAWVIHLTGDLRGRERPPSADVGRWHDALNSSLLAITPCMKAPLCVETLDFPFEYVMPVVREHGLAVCLDVGHLMLYGYDVDAYCRNWFDLAKVIHLHGLVSVNGVVEDHRDIASVPEPVLLKLLKLLCSEPVPDRSVILEMFTQQEVEFSAERLRKLASKVKF